MLSHIIYNHYQPESHGSHSTAASGDSLISRSLAYVDSDGPPGVHDGHAITLIDVLCHTSCAACATCDYCVEDRRCSGGVGLVGLGSCMDP